MFFTKYLISTLKEIPYYTDTISHTLMVRAGLIRQLASGLYTWLPTGLRVLNNIKKIICEEMNKIGALEILIPIMQPKDIWKKSNRLNTYGNELIKFKDRNNRSFILSPTNEEIITYLIKNEINSYKSLPIHLYQIQTKFRDEIRPKFGTIRLREFIMKDSYSFHENYKSLENTYYKIQKTYRKIFNRIGLKFVKIKANTGYIGGTKSHEFHSFSKNGDNKISITKPSNYTSNIELTKFIRKINKISLPIIKLFYIYIKNIKNIKELSYKINISIKKILKIFIVKGSKKSNPFIALILRGDHKLNLLKTEKIKNIFSPLYILNDKEIYNFLGIKSIFLGPIGLKIPIIADFSVSKMNNFISGSNINNKYLIGINWKIDLPLPIFKNIRNVITGDTNYKNKEKIYIKKSIEIGHIFMLGDKYSKIMNSNFQNKFGKKKNLIMGCYGIGITRIVSAVIEQNYDINGIKWPISISPFQIALIPINMHKFNNVKKIAKFLYIIFKQYKFEIILDDRKESPGIMLKDIKLIGIPHIIIINNINLKKKNIEYLNRINNTIQIMNIKNILKLFLKI
ncbi:Proline--tRNA ligase [Candidatus Annandia adelgestsuga]|uniref:Proline--tRNA ligase n=1 Tax=Candidatus Annandia adelgestsuga TaxID=1302411 RepID=A0A3S9J7C5_9ENTR|nr:proline--tRNA ligase [Candidatus Annandia adelgestsuga]AZP36174.1 Proline--tRNA ligase [Candidatus Annandia adelgestsuga]